MGRGCVSPRGRCHPAGAMRLGPARAPCPPGRPGWGLVGSLCPLFFPWGFLGARQGGLTCGMAGRGQQGLGEQRQRREAAGRAGGIAMATRAFGSLRCGAQAASGLAVHPDAALDPSFCGRSVPPAPTAILPGEQPWCCVRLRQLLFARVEALSCRAGPAGRKPVSEALSLNHGGQRGVLQPLLILS